MIDELVREALDTQVGPPPALATWDQIDRAAGIGRQRRRRARIASVAGAVAMILLVGAAAVAALTHRGTSGVQVATGPTATQTSGPSVATAARHLPTRADWSTPRGAIVVERSFAAARTADDGTRLILYWPGGNACDQPASYELSMAPASVVVHLFGIDQGEAPCPYAWAQIYVVPLPSALGNRTVVDGSTGKRVRMLDSASLLVPRQLPAGWSAQTEGLSAKGTWSRCYGVCGISHGPEVTTAQGPDLGDVLLSGLGQIDDVIPGNLTYFGQPVSKRPFAYGGNSELHGQPIPAKDRLAVDVNGHDGVQLSSWANLIVVWQDGTTWHAVATSRDRRTTDGPQVGIGPGKLVAFARSLAPAR